MDGQVDTEVHVSWKDRVDRHGLNVGGNGEKERETLAQAPFCC